MRGPCAAILCVAALVASTSVVSIAASARMTTAIDDGLAGAVVRVPLAGRWAREGIVLDLGAPGGPDSAGTMNPYVLQDEGTFRMWYRGSDGRNRIMYATSSDGITWSRQGVVFDIDSPPHYFDSVAGASVLKEGGVYRMWFGAGFWEGPFGMVGRIYYAESTDAVTWSSGSVALEEGPAGLWDGVLVGYPMVTKDATGRYFMYYGGWDGSTIRIGIATSLDGLSFARVQPSPILVAGSPGSWDDDHVNSPFVIPGTPWRMVYMGFDGLTQRIGLAQSPDGVAWTKSPENPEFVEGAPGSWDDAGVWGHALLSDGPDLSLYYTGFDGEANRIGLARFQPENTPGIVDCNPDTINLRSRGRWITCYLEPESTRSADQVEAVSVRLDSRWSPVLDERHGFSFDPDGYLVDHDRDGVLERLLKFDRRRLSGALSVGIHVFLIEGRYTDGTTFSIVSETIRIIP